jgi:hypothetical protein
MREIATGDGFTGQSDLRAPFGLGDAAKVDLLRIEWPIGVVQELTNVAADQIMAVTEHQAGATTAPSLTALDGGQGGPSPTAVKYGWLISG